MNLSSILFFDWLLISFVSILGMSTVPEVIVARHCGMTVFSFSLITNECITDYDAQGEANHEEVIETANKRQNDLKLFVTRIVSSIADGMKPSNDSNGSLLLADK